MYIRVYFFLDKFCDCYIEEWETIGELKLKLFNYFKIPIELFQYFCLYEERDTISYIDESIVEDDVKTADVLASWEFSARHDIEKEKQFNVEYLNKELPYLPINSRIFLKVRIFSQKPEF